MSEGVSEFRDPAERAYSFTIRRADGPHICVFSAILNLKIMVNIIDLIIKTCLPSCSSLYYRFDGGLVNLPGSVD